MGKFTEIPAVHLRTRHLRKTVTVTGVEPATEVARSHQASVLAQAERVRVESQLRDFRWPQVEAAVEHSLSGEHVDVLSFLDCRDSETPRYTDWNPKFERLLPESHCRADRR